MRIIGNFRVRSFIFLMIIKRPLKDIIKESIFNLITLKNKFECSKFGIDFIRSGSFGARMYFKTSKK